MSNKPKHPAHERNSTYEDLEFSYNWNNKLQCNVFTTIRLADYPVGKRFNVFLKGEFLYTATIIEKVERKLSTLNNFICYLDTGYDVVETRNIITRMYQKYNVNWVTKPLYIYQIQKNKV